MRILVLTDSLSLPRNYSTGTVKWEDIYVSLLRKAYPDQEFIHVGIGAATIKDLHSQLNYYQNINPNIVILQTGIVDCAPRALGVLEQQIVFRLRLFRLFKPFTKILRRLRKISYTNPDEFVNTLTRIKERFPGVTVYSLGILPACSEYENKVPGISKNIHYYNELLSANTEFINVSDISYDFITEDHHHLNEKGHQFIFQKLSSVLEKNNVRKIGK
jgi:hypothetical protein